MLFNAFSIYPRCARESRKKNIFMHNISNSSDIFPGLFHWDKKIREYYRIQLSDKSNVDISEGEKNIESKEEKKHDWEKKEGKEW